MRIVTDNQPFNCRLVLSATSDALRTLAGHLEVSNLEAASECLATLDANLRLREASEPTVQIDFRTEPPFQVHLPSAVGVRLGARLEPEDPLGTYQVEATIYDQISGDSPRLRTSLVVESGLGAR